MLIIGLTGSIGMGKSTAAARFKANGIAVSDADKIVHDLYRGAAVDAIEAAFPAVTNNGEVDRQKLSAALIAEPAGFKRLEAIVHPLVRMVQKTFLRAEFERGAAFAVLEIPLLFETGISHLVDVVVTVSAPQEIQRQRVLLRPGMSAAKLDNLLARQTPDGEKRAASHFVVDTGGSIEQSGLQVDRIIATVSDRPGQAYESYWS